MKLFFCLLIVLPFLALTTDAEITKNTEQIISAQQPKLRSTPELVQMSDQQPQFQTLSTVPLQMQSVLLSEPISLSAPKPVLYTNQAINLQNSNDLLGDITSGASPEQYEMLSGLLSQAQTTSFVSQDGDQKRFIDLNKQNEGEKTTQTKITTQSQTQTVVAPELVRNMEVISESSEIQPVLLKSTDAPKETIIRQETATPTLMTLTTTTTTTSSTSHPISDPVPIIEISTTCPHNSVPNHEKLCIKPKYIEGCSVYSTALECYSCVNGYKLDSHTKKCQYNPLYNGKITHIIGCLEQIKEDSCNICATGFYRFEKKCSIGIKNCISYNKQRQCLDCEQDYSLIMSECRHNYLLGCKQETTSHTCKECYPPFEINGQHCDVPDCRTLNDFGCVACECGFYLTSTRLCKPIAPGCLRYERGVCKDCLRHYKLKGGVCEIEGCLNYTGNYCDKCMQAYIQVEGECHFKECYDWLNDNCLICKEGFGIYNGHCKPIQALKCQ